MNEETITFRLDQIEKKLDTLTDILLQTQAQEIRLSTVEKAIKELRNEKTKSVDRWLTPLISTCISGVVAWILVKVGVK